MKRGRERVREIQLSDLKVETLGTITADCFFVSESGGEHLRQIEQTNYIGRKFSWILHNELKRR